MSEDYIILYVYIGGLIRRTLNGECISGILKYSTDIPTKEAFSTPNIGDKVYLICIGYVRVNSVDKDGTITFNTGRWTAWKA